MSNPKLEASEDIPRPDPDMMGDEWDSLSQWLDFHRATFRLKCAGLTDDQLKLRPVATSTLSLLGLMRHLTEVERGWFAETLAGQNVDPLYWSKTDPDGDFDRLDSRPVQEVEKSYLAAITEAHEIVASFEDASDLRRHPTQRPVTVRWVMMHMVEEYARHNGHADLLREAIDGARGE